MTTLKSNMLKKGKKGFTLTELAIVIAVIAILIAVLVPTFTSVITSAKETAAAEDASNAIKAYTLENTDVVPDGSILVVDDTYYFIVESSTVIYSEDADTTAYNAELAIITNIKAKTIPTGYSEFNWTYTENGSTVYSEYYSNYNGYITIYLLNEVKTADSTMVETIWKEYQTLFTTGTNYIAVYDSSTDTTAYYTVTVSGGSSSVDSSNSSTSVDVSKNYEAVSVDVYSNVTLYIYSA